MGEFVLPNVCKNTTVLLAVVFTQLCVTVFMLAGIELFDLSRYGMVTIYVQLVTLASLAVLCLLRPVLLHYSHGWAFLWSFLACFSVFCLIETVTQFVYLLQFDAQRWWRLAAAAMLVILIVLRFFSLLGLYNQRAKQEVENRMQVLQARIQPHFLFNSLNTIAELTHINPVQAEQAIQSLSALFRSTVSDEGYFHSVAEEVQLCKQYLQLEHWRLGERLVVDWQVDFDELNDLVMPRLLLQPLVENAILHGIAPSLEPGNVMIRLQRKNKFLHIAIENSLPLHVDGGVDEPSAGTGMALNNIKERLFVVYDDQYQFHHRRAKDVFLVELSLPVQPEVSTWEGNK